MNKIICETTGDFQLVDFGSEGRVIPAFRPSVSPLTAFVSQRAAAGQIRVLANVSEAATDEEFQKYLKDSDGDVTLAIEAFKSTYPVTSAHAEKSDEAVVSAPTTRKRRT